MDNLLEKIISNKKAEELSKLNAIKLVNSLFDELLERERDILTRRFALKGGEAETLEQIGRLHKLTRERVRQIESSSLRKLKKLEYLDSYLSTVKSAVSQLLQEHGGLMDREFLLDVMAMFCIDTKGDDSERDLYKKNFDFIISQLLEDQVDKVDKSNEFNSYYKLKDNSIEHLEDLAKEITRQVEKGNTTMTIDQLLELINKSDSYNRHQDKLKTSIDSNLHPIFKSEIFPEKAEVINANKVLYSLIQAAKNIDRNKFGHWGINEWPEIKPKKISDKIYLILKNNGQPMHFTDIAAKINEIGFDSKKANAGTVHNELILDDRYELVGRGLYALKEWAK
ncbi:MAG TPA: sigma factor-like helix-turn-helix DNA-binding protein [bacterium]|nr:sigma factor-like helix-turn-helix DNA-binding protein [bacterium]HPT29600.1 sigma factor-like helix-turn-helix DNA-binding protein [bacterium]